MCKCKESLKNSQNENTDNVHEYNFVFDNDSFFAKEGIDDSQCMVYPPALCKICDCGAFLLFVLSLVKNKASSLFNIVIIIVSSPFVGSQQKNSRTENSVLPIH